MRHLLRRGARIHATDQQGNTPLHLAAANDHCAEAALLVSRGAGTARQRSRDGVNVLHLACLAGSARTVRSLLTFGQRAADAARAAAIERAGKSKKARDAAAYVCDAASRKWCFCSSPEDRS